MFRLLQTTRMLLVDGNPFHQEVLARAIRSEASEVQLTTVDSSEDWLRALSSQAFECAIVDCELQDLPTDELLRRIFQHDKSCPVIAVSLSRSQEVVIACLRASCVGVNYCLGAQLSPQVIAATDDALYLAKELGRDQVCITDMVAVNVQLTSSREKNHCDPAANRLFFLSLMKDKLDPTQWACIAEHCESVSEATAQLAAMIQMEPQSTANLCLAALTHDLGKCNLPEAMLAKSSPLTMEERHVMRIHGRISAWIADRLGCTTPVIKLIREHHRLDSHGAAIIDVPLRHSFSVSSAPLTLMDIAKRLINVRDSHEADIEQAAQTAALQLEALAGKAFDSPQLRDITGHPHRRAA